MRCKSVILLTSLTLGGCQTRLDKAALVFDSLKTCLSNTWQELALAKTEDPVLARIEGFPIRVSEFKKRVLELPPAQQKLPSAAIRREILDRLILDKTAVVLAKN